MIHHPLADKIQHQNKKFNENANILFLNRKDLNDLSQWAFVSGHKLLRDNDNNPENYWGLTIITVDDNFFKAAFFKETDIQLAIENNLEVIEKIKYKYDKVKRLEDTPYTEYLDEDGFELVQIPLLVKKAYQQYLNKK